MMTIKQVFERTHEDDYHSSAGSKRDYLHMMVRTATGEWCMVADENGEPIVHSWWSGDGCNHIPDKSGGVEYSPAILPIPEDEVTMAMLVGQTNTATWEDYGPDQVEEIYAVSKYDYVELASTIQKKLTYASNNQLLAVARVMGIF